MGPGENPGRMCIMLPPGPPLGPIMPIIPGGMSLGWWCIMPPSGEWYIGSPQLAELQGTELLVSCWLICAIDEMGSKFRFIGI